MELTVVAADVIHRISHLLMSEPLRDETLAVAEWAAAHGLPDVLAALPGAGGDDPRRAKLEAAARLRAWVRRLDEQGEEMDPRGEMQDRLVELRALCGEQDSRRASLRLVCWAACFADDRAEFDEFLDEWLPANGDAAVAKLRGQCLRRQVERDSDARGMLTPSVQYDVSSVADAWERAIAKATGPLHPTMRSTPADGDGSEEEEEEEEEDDEENLSPIALAAREMRKAAARSRREKLKHARVLSRDKAPAPPAKKAKRAKAWRQWTQLELDDLRRGAAKHQNRWTAVVRDPDLIFYSGARTAHDLKLRYQRLRKQGQA